jgi:hypothetical protein
MQMAERIERVEILSQFTVHCDIYRQGNFTFDFKSSFL